MNWVPWLYVGDSVLLGLTVGIWTMSFRKARLKAEAITKQKVELSQQRKDLKDAMLASLYTGGSSAGVQQYVADAQGRMKGNREELIAKHEAELKGRKEPIIGYRGFKIGPLGGDHHDYALKSTNQEYYWGKGELKARCLVDPLLGLHEAPHKDCHCGLYAYSSPSDERARNGWVGASALVIGYGRILQYPNGWRSEYARIIAFYYDATTLYVVKEIADEFGVPLVPMHEIEALAKEHGQAYPYPGAVPKELLEGPVSNTSGVLNPPRPLMGYAWSGSTGVSSTTGGPFVHSGVSNWHWTNTAAPFGANACPACNGTGYDLASWSVGTHVYARVCPRCGGTGK